MVHAEDNLSATASHVDTVEKTTHSKHKPKFPCKLCEGRDYVYAMQAVVSTFFRVMYFNHGEEIVTIDQLDFLDLSPDPTRDQVFPLLIPSVSIDTILPQVSYVASCPLCSIATKK